MVVATDVMTKFKFSIDPKKYIKASGNRYDTCDIYLNPKSYNGNSSKYKCTNLGSIIVKYEKQYFLICEQCKWRLKRGTNRVSFSPDESPKKLILKNDEILEVEDEGLKGN